MHTMSRRLAGYVAGSVKAGVLILSLLLISAISYIRYWTGPEYAFSIFYFFPILVMTWVWGLIAGCICATISALAWLMADLEFLHTFSSPRVPFINETFRLVVFLAFVFLIWELRQTLNMQQKLARTDALTGLANRRAFMEFAEVELKRAGRFSLPLTILCMDVDNFKSVNDRYGHQAGDRLLTELAQTLLGNIRAIDMASRFGGDEFCILFSGADEINAHRIVRKLGDKLTSTMQANNWPVTFSSGVVTYKTAPDSIEDMLKAADNLMYQAKENGKNNIIHQVIA